jgi:hypothetical protein
VPYATGDNLLRLICPRRLRVRRTVPTVLPKAIYTFGWYFRICAGQAACQYRATDTGWPVGVYCAIAHGCDVLSVTNDFVSFSITVFEVEGCEVGLICIRRIREVNN